MPTLAWGNECVNAAALESNGLIGSLDSQSDIPLVCPVRHNVDYGVAIARDS
jgi:hypothetical protein